MRDGRQELGVFVEDERERRVLDDDGAVRNRLDDHLVLVLGGRAPVGRAAKAEDLRRLVFDAGVCVIRAEGDLTHKIECYPKRIRKK